MSNYRGNRILITILENSSRFTHLVIGAALVAATLLITLYFFQQIYAAIETHTLIDGFLHSLGTLLLLWTISELVGTEIGFLRGEEVDFAIFVEVAMVVVVREVIMLPVENRHPGVTEIGIWVGAAALLGLTYFLIRSGQSMLRKRRQSGHEPSP